MKVIGYMCVSFDLNNHQMNSHKKLDVDYLIKENRKLRLQLKQALQLGNIHKEAVVKLTDKAGNNSEVVKALASMLRLSSQQGAKERLRDQIFDLEGQVMVLQKIVNQTYENERETYLLLVDQFRVLQDQNSRMQLKLQSFYQKIGEVDYLSGLVTKYKEIIAPQELALANKRQQDQLLDMLNLQREQIRKLTQQKQKLLKINVHMKEEVERKKDEVINMTMMILKNDEKNNEGISHQMILGDLDNQHETEQTGNEEEKAEGKMDRMATSMIQMRQNLSTMNVTQNPNTTLNFVKLQRELIKEVDEENINDSQESDQEFDCPQLSILFPDKVQQIKNNRQEAKIPYLNMKKVRQLMMKREQKMKKQIQAEGHHINPTTKIIQLQSQLDITRKQLTSQMLKFRTMLDQNKKMTQHILQLQNRNEMLVKQYENLSHNYKNVYKDYQLCKSITNEVERITGRKISDEKNVLNAREELSSIMLIGDQQNSQQSKVNTMVSSIFRDKRPQTSRRLSPP